jgi:hypothetical protein
VKLSVRRPTHKGAFFGKVETINADTIIAFLSYLLFVLPGLVLHIILDQARYHTCAAVEEWAAKNPRIKLHFLPAYSPNLNTIERVVKEINQAGFRSGRNGAPTPPLAQRRRLEASACALLITLSRREVTFFQTLACPGCRLAAGKSSARWTRRTAMPVQGWSAAGPVRQ